MFEFLRDLFDADGFMPHGHCYLWRPAVLWLNVISDAIVTLSYLSIPFTLFYFVRKRQDTPFSWMFWCFGIFILSCGSTHLLEIVTIWHPVYWLAGGVKAITAASSVMTAVLLVRMVPRALAIPSTRELAEARDKLSAAKAELERKVAERTQELTSKNTELAAEIAEHARSTEALRKSLKEREVLLQEIHHRVKNNLQIISSLINMQMRELEASSTRIALEECKTRVLAIALIHEKLYESKDYAHVQFADYARGLATTVFETVGVSEREVSLHLAIDDVSFSIDRAIPCGLLINELLTNSLKHGFKNGRTGTIWVALSQLDPATVRLSVRDDGAGLPPGFDMQTADSMGLHLVRMLARQLGATIAVDGTAGAAFELTFSVDVPS